MCRFIKTHRFSLGNQKRRRREEYILVLASGYPCSHLWPIFKPFILFKKQLACRQKTQEKILILKSITTALTIKLQQHANMRLWNITSLIFGGSFFFFQISWIILKHKSFYRYFHSKSYSSSCNILHIIMETIIKIKDIRLRTPLTSLYFFYFKIEFEIKELQQ